MLLLLPCHPLDRDLFVAIILSINRFPFQLLHRRDCCLQHQLFVQPDSILAKQMKGLRRIMRPLKARGKEWVHEMASSAVGGGGSGSGGGGGGVVTANGKVSRLGGGAYYRRNAKPSGGGPGNVEEDVDSDGSDLVRGEGGGIVENARTICLKINQNRLNIYWTDLKIKWSDSFLN